MSPSFLSEISSLFCIFLQNKQAEKWKWSAGLWMQLIKSIQLYKAMVKGNRGVQQRRIRLAMSWTLREVFSHCVYPYSCRKIWLFGFMVIGFSAGHLLDPPKKWSNKDRNQRPFWTWLEGAVWSTNSSWWNSEPFAWWAGAHVRRCKKRSGQCFGTHSQIVIGFGETISASWCKWKLMDLEL